MSASGAEVAGIVGEFDEVALTKSGGLIATDGGEGQGLAVRRDIGNADGESGIVARPLELGKAEHPGVAGGGEGVDGRRGEDECLSATGDVRNYDALGAAVIVADGKGSAPAAKRFKLASGEGLGQ